MAKAKAHRRRAGMTVPLAVLAGFAPLGVSTIEGFKQNGAEGAMHYAVAGLTGWDTRTNKWELAYMTRGTIPIVLGFLVHYAASRLGVNRALGRARVPFLRI